MKARTLIAVAALVVSASTCAETIKSGCAGFEWDYPAASLDLIDGFKFYLDGAVKVTVPANTQTVTCAALGLTQGKHTAEVSAYNAVGESAKSVALPFGYVTAVPADKPGNLRLK